MVTKYDLEKKYKLYITDVEELKRKGYSRMSDTTFCYRFPLNRYKGTITLVGYITTNIEDKKIKLDVEAMNGSILPDFYDNTMLSSSPYADFISGLNHKFVQEFRKIGIKQIKNKEKKQNDRSETRIA